MLRSLYHWSIYNILNRSLGKHLSELKLIEVKGKLLSELTFENDNKVWPQVPSSRDTHMPRQTWSTYWWKVRRIADEDPFKTGIGTIIESVHNKRWHLFFEEAENLSIPVCGRWKLSVKTITLNFTIFELILN